MAGKIFFVKGMVVNFDFRVSSEVVGHEHDRDVDVLQLPENIQRVGLRNIAILRSLVFPTKHSTTAECIQPLAWDCQTPFA